MAKRSGRRRNRKQPNTRRTYNKLVRDKVPDVLQALGHDYKCYPLDANDPKYEKALRAKVVEEAEEVRDADGRDAVAAELADLMTVVDALLTLHGLTADELTAAIRAKWEKRGGFAERLWMVWIDRHGKKDTQV